MSPTGRSAAAPTAFERLRHAFWPACGWRRAVVYHWKRILRLPATAHAAGLGAAIGVFVSFTPLLGGRLALSIAAAALVRANPIAAALGSHFGNPLVYPFLFVVCVEIGRLILGEPLLGPPSVDDLGRYVWPALVGLGLVGSLTSLAVYWVVVTAVRRYQAVRKARLSSVRRLREGGRDQSTGSGMRNEARQSAARITR